VSVGCLVWKRAADILEYLQFVAPLISTIVVVQNMFAIVVLEVRKWCYV
jgi:hypothetical protein